MVNSGHSGRVPHVRRRARPLPSPRIKPKPSQKSVLPSEIGAAVGSGVRNGSRMAGGELGLSHDADVGIQFGMISPDAVEMGE